MVNPDGVVLLRPFAKGAENDGVVLCSTKQEGHGALLVYIFQWHGVDFSFVQLYAVPLIPVSADDNMPAVHLQPLCPAALTVHTAVTLECMVCGIVFLRHKLVADAQGL